MNLVKNLVLIFIFTFLCVSTYKNFVNYQAKRIFYEDYKKRYEDEKKKNITFKTELLKKSDVSEIEKTIRNKLNLLKENEVAIMIPSPTPKPVVLVPTPLPIWHQWWDVFFGKE